MAGQIAQKQAAACERRREKQIHFVEDFGGVLDQQVADALGLQVLNGRDEAPFAEGIRPGAAFLLFHQIVAAAAREVIESGGSFGGQEKGNFAYGIIRKFERGQISAQVELPDYPVSKISFLLSTE